MCLWLACLPAERRYEHCLTGVISTAPVLVSSYLITSRCALSCQAVLPRTYSRLFVSGSLPSQSITIYSTNVFESPLSRPTRPHCARIQPKMVILDAVDFMTKDYRKRFQTALAFLTDIYAADVAASSMLMMAGDTARATKPEGQRSKQDPRKPRGFDLYDEALVSLLKTLSGSLQATWRQKLFTQTLLECPRVPPAALELVCNLCDIAAKPHDVQTGELSNKETAPFCSSATGRCYLVALRCLFFFDRGAASNTK